MLLYCELFTFNCVWMSVWINSLKLIYRSHLHQNSTVRAVFQKFLRQLRQNLQFTPPLSHRIKYQMELRLPFIPPLLPLIYRVTRQVHCWSSPEIMAPVLRFKKVQFNDHRFFHTKTAESRRLVQIRTVKYRQVGSEGRYRRFGLSEVFRLRLGVSVCLGKHQNKEKALMERHIGKGTVFYQMTLKHQLVLIAHRIKPLIIIWCLPKLFLEDRGIVIHLKWSLQR